MFKVILMYSEEHKRDMWWLERLINDPSKPDYIGPFISNLAAHDFMNTD